MPLAFATDRFIACVLDFLIISPVVSFFVASFLRDLKTLLILDNESPEANVIWLIVVFCVVILSSVIQALFLYFWQATPGQKFMQLKVISFPQWLNERKRLSFSQALLRSLGWWLGALSLGLPFLEILGHPLRRAFHERLSDTMVISLKQEKAEVPLAIESRYIGSTLWVFFGFLILLGLTLMSKAYRNALVQGMSAKHQYAQSRCEQVPRDIENPEKRVDMAMSLYLTEDVDDLCVYNEAQRLMWGAEDESKALAGVAMGMIGENSDEAKDYYNRACEESPSSEACALGKYFISQDADRGEILRQAGYGLVVSQVAATLEAMDRGEFVTATQLMKSYEHEAPLRAFVQKNWVRAAWVLNEKQHEKPGRKPASQDDETRLVQEFKERFQLK